MLENNLPEVPQETQRESVALVQRASDITISSEESFNLANDIKNQMKERVKYFKAVYAPFIDSRKAALKKVQDKLKSETDPLEQKAGLLQNKINKYLTALAEKEEAERRRKDAAAREAARKKQEKAETKADEYLENGNFEKAEAELDKAENTFADPVDTKQIDKTTKTASTTITRMKKYDVSVRNLKELLKAVIEGKAPIACVSINVNKLKKHAELNKLKGIDIPGCQITITETARQRKR